MNKRILMALAASLALSAPALGVQPSAVNQPRGVPTPGPGARGGDWRGMMDGWGYGGMMGGQGMMGGPGMMGGWSGGERIPDLTADQRSKMTAIHRDLRNRQFALMDQMHDTWAATRTYRGGKFDEQAARRAYDESEKLHRQMFENMLDAQKRVDALLTPAQRQAMEQRAGR